MGSTNSMVKYWYPSPVDSLMKNNNNKIETLISNNKIEPNGIYLPIELWFIIFEFTGYYGLDEQLRKKFSIMCGL